MQWQMNRTLKTLPLLWMVILLFVVACTSKDKDDMISNLIDRAPVIPKTVEEIVRYPQGLLAEKDFQTDLKDMVASVQKYLPPIKKEVDEAYLESWWQAFYYLFAKTYPDPEEIVNQINFESIFSVDDKKIDEKPDSRYLIKKQINVLVVLDVSGSMAEVIDGKSMMDIAKDSIREFTLDLPGDANIGLRAYGHEGKDQGLTKEQSCNNTELVYDIQRLNSEEFQAIIDPFEPTGWTPIALSLQEAKKDFASFTGEENTNLVYIVSDGAETCDGDPVAAAEELADSNIQPIINVIGFNVNTDGQRHLKEIADAGGGIYTDVENEVQFREVFNQAKEMMRQWKQWEKEIKENARLHKITLLKDIDDKMHQWTMINNSERVNLFYTINELRNNQYITEEAHIHFARKRSDRTILYNNLWRNKYQHVFQLIENEYEELMKKVDIKFDLE